MYDFSSIFGDSQQGKNPFDPLAPQGSGVPPTTLSANIGNNPNVAATQQAISQPAPAPIGGTGAVQSLGQDLDPLAAKSPQPVKQGTSTNTQSLLDHYSKLGDGGGGLLKLVAAFL